jgi:site-specific DNA recombinase
MTDQLLAAYLRDSDGDSQDLSTAQQENEIHRWASRHGYLISRVFKEEARAGSSMVGRKGFKEMMRYFRQSGIQEVGVVFWKMSRFVRDIDDPQFYKADLRRRGYEIISLNDSILDGPEGRFFEAAIDWRNQRFLEDLSTDVKRGLRNLVETFGCVPGTPPRGFKRDAVQLGVRRDGQPRIGHRWVPDSEYIYKIKRAFDLKAAGYTVREIHREVGIYKSLNGYTTFFKNKLYTGILEYSGLVIEDYCEPIVDRGTFDRVQKIVQSHVKKQRLSNSLSHPRRSSSNYILSGIAFCARCGAPLSGHSSGIHRGKQCTRYECSGGRHKGGSVSSVLYFR